MDKFPSATGEEIYDISVMTNRGVSPCWEATAKRKSVFIEANPSGGKRKGGERFHGVPLEEAGSGLCDTSRLHGHGEGHQNARAEHD